MKFKLITTLFFAATTTLFSCKSNPATQPQTDKSNTTLTPSNDVKMQLINCYIKTLNRDTTTITLNVNNDSTVQGKMVWHPYQKDGAVGTLSGKQNEAGELVLLYDYMIEGNKQTETKIMKIEGNNLLLKIGELQDVNNNGNLTFIDVTKAKYTDTLRSYTCPQ